MHGIGRNTHGTLIRGVSRSGGCYFVDIATMNGPVTLCVSMPIAYRAGSANLITLPEIEGLQVGETVSFRGTSLITIGVVLAIDNSDDALVQVRTQSGVRTLRAGSAFMNVLIGQSVYVCGDAVTVLRPAHPSPTLAVS